MSKKSEPFVVMMTLDRESSSVVLTRSDGKEARQPMGQSPFESTSLLSRLHYSPALGGLLAVTCKGDDIAFELPARDGRDQLERRLVVYLDQNMWRPVSEALQGGATEESKDRDAANQLAEWVRDRRIVSRLPPATITRRRSGRWRTSGTASA